MDNYDKPFKTFDELLDVLEHDHGLVIPDRKIAKNILEFIPYYDLANGYKEILMDKEHFRNGINMGGLFLFHLLDHDFQNALFAYSVTIEDYFKNILAYVIAESFGVDHHEYLKYNHYVSKKSLGKNTDTRRDRILPSIMRTAETSLDNPTLYYRQHHNHIPPWILLKNTTFNMATKLFQILKRDQRKAVLDFMIPTAQEPEQRYPVLLYALTNIRKCRNTIAHNLKFTSFNCGRYMNRLNKGVLRQLISSTLLTDKELDNYKFLDGVYGYIILSLSLVPSSITRVLMIRQLLSTLLFDPSLKQFSSLNAVIPPLYYKGLNLPPDLAGRLDKYLKEISSSKPYRNT